MRKEIYRMAPAEALALLARAPAVHLATTTPDGLPLARTVHGVVVGDAVAFHGAPAGEKVDSIGRPAVVWAEEVVASIPSYFVDPERACPATTYYRSVQVHGPIEEVADSRAKTAVLAALMARFQPEGGHVPIDPGHPLYRKAVAGILVLRVPFERLDGKAKLGQNRGPAERAHILERLWARGGPGDPRAVDLVRAGNPDTPVPAFLACPEGASLACALGPEDAPAAADLMEGTYWNVGFTRAEIVAAHAGSPAWVGARDPAGRLVASARAIGDGAKRAWIYDVVVAPAWRRRGLGGALLRLLLDHPGVRGARQVWLQTRDQQRLYARFGFVERADLSPRGGERSTMVLERRREGERPRISTALGGDNPV
jgi:nitroimidazol reductase NimA-like FMN-containing flavoprotein (pyridoxamine 5'-phosphate oxidase superfamily)/ribosomal protein S18 acetylase RimI-like enzyme